jgi:hypothetical protein
MMYCVFENVENHAYWQKLFEHNLRLQESPGTICRSGAEYQAGCNPGLVDRRGDHVKIALKYNMELVAGNFFFTTYTPGTDVLLCYFNYCTGEPLPFLIAGVNDGPECQGP